MKLPVAAITCIAVMALVSISSPSLAGQKTARQCQDGEKGTTTQNEPQVVKGKHDSLPCVATEPHDAKGRTATAPVKEVQVKKKERKKLRWHWFARKPRQMMMPAETGAIWW